MVKKSAKKKARVLGVVKDDIVREIAKINRTPSLAELNKFSQKRSNSSSSRNGSSGHAMTKAHNSIGSSLSKLTSSTVAEIVAGMALPCDHPTKRIKIGYSSDPTGVAQPFVSFSYNATAVPVADGNAGYGSILMFRDVLRASAIFYPNTAAYTYNLYFNNPSLTEGVTLTYKWAEATVNPLPIAYALAVGSDGPHGSTLYAGEHEGRVGIFMNYEETITFQSTSTYELIVYYLSGQRWQLVTVIQSSGGQYTAAYANTGGSSISGYYAFEVANPVAGTTEFNLAGALTTSGNQDVWGFSPIPNVNNKATSFTGLRVNAVSCLMSCTASDLNANGTIVAAQFNSSYDWARTMNAGFDNILSDISSTSSNYAGPAKNGCYGFLKPSNAADFDFQTPFMVDATSEVVTSYNFKLVSPSPMMWFVFQTGLTSSSYPGSEFQVTQHWGVEFTTYDPWYEKLPCYLSSSTFEQAMTALSQIQQFHENKVHWKDILAQIKKFAMITPEILGLISTAVPQLRPAALIAGGIKGYFKG